MPFAAIQLKDTMIGGMADTDGVYSIDVPASGGGSPNDYLVRLFGKFSIDNDSWY